MKASLERKVLALILALSLYVATGLNDTFWTPFFPLKTKELGISESVTGLIASSYDFSGLVSCIVMMFLNNDMQVYTFCAGSFIVGVGCMAFGQLIYGPHGLTFIAMCIVTRTVQGLGSTLLWCSGSPLLLSLFPKHTGRICSFFESSASLGIILGAPIGSALYSLGGYTMPFWVVGAIQCVLPIFCFFGFPSMSSREKMEASRSITSGMKQGSALSFITHPGIISISLAATFVNSSIGFLAVALAPFLHQQFHIDVKNAGQFFLPFTVIRGFSAPLLAYFVDKGYAGLVFSASGCVLHAITFLILGCSQYANWINNLYGLQLLLLVGGFSSAAALLPTIILFRKIYLRAEARNTFIVDTYAAAVSNICFTLGLIIGQSFVGGFVFQNMGFHNSCLVEALLCGITSILGTGFLAHRGLLRKIPPGEEKIMDKEDSLLSSKGGI